MTDATTYSDSDFSPVDGSAAIPSPQTNLPAPIVSTDAGPTTMDSWNASTSDSNTPITYNDTDFSPVPITGESKIDTGKGGYHPDTPLDTAKDFAFAYINTGGDYARNAVNTIAGVGKSAYDYVKNFDKEHQLVPGHTMSPQEMQAAKILNVSPNGVMDYFFGTNTAPNVTHPTYKSDPLTDEDIGLDPVKYVLTKGPTAQLVKTVAFPQESSTRQQARIQEVSKLLDVVNNPSQYTPDIVKKAQASIEQTKNEANASIASKVVEGFKGLLQHPLIAAQSFLDPAFLMLGELKLGDMAVGTDLASSVKAGKAARSIAQEAAKFKEQIAGLNVVNKAAVLEKAQKYVDVYTGVAEKAAANAKRLQTLKGAGNLVGSAASGAGINAGATAIQENLEEGDVRPIDVTSSAATGAILGGTVGALGHEEPVTSDTVRPEQTDTAKARQGNPGSMAAGHQPGDPLPADTPVIDKGFIPYTGAIAKGKTGLHVDEDFPTTKELENRGGEKVTLPVKDIVTQVHEAEEGPLMHPSGPMTLEKFAELYKRAGRFANKTIFSDAIRNKILEGEPLPYPEGHAIATAIENNHVETVYNVDHKVYQDSLKPHIKEIAAKVGKVPKSEIPESLDRKPYEDMGHPEQLPKEGEGAPPEQGQPGAGESKTPISDKDISPINARTVGAAVLTLGAGAYGAYQAGPGHRTEGTFKGLFGGMTMFGHQAIFAGARASRFDPSSAAEAVRMRSEGKTPEQINFKTGMYEGAGGHWYHEISDHAAKVSTDIIEGNNPTSIALRKGSGVPLRSILKHTHMDIDYPGLSDKIHVRIDPGVHGGQYNFHTGNITIGPPRDFPTTGIDTFRKVLLHEVNHAVQHYEGFPRGDSPQAHIKALQEHAEDLQNQYHDIITRQREAEREGNQVYVKTLQRESEEVARKIDALAPGKIDKIAWDRYHRSAGENMSVAVQERADLSPEQRRMQVPKTEYRNEGQLVKYNAEPSTHLTGKLGIGEGVAAHEMPISDHLQKTGEMDEEGKLSGMILPEDKLPNEHEVLAKAAQNDQGAISKLYKQYMPRLIRNARGLMRTAGPRLGMDAEDLAMYVFHKAIMHLKAGTFKGDSSFYTWMHTILHNTGLNEISRAGRTVPTESIHGATHDAFGSPVSDIKPTVRNIDSGEGTPEDNMIARQTSNMVQHAIAKLPQDIREAIKAYEFDGKSYEEIAREQNVPVGTVRSRLNRGRDMIEQSIKRGHGANFRKQGGFATVDQMKRAALLGIGAFAGYSLGGPDHRMKDAFYGALAGIGAGAITFRGIARVVHDVRSADTLPRASSTLDKLEGSLAKLQRHTDMVQTQMAAAQGADSLNIAHSIEGDTSIKLTPGQQKVKETAQALYTHIRDMAKAAGMSMKELENYTTHLFKPTEANKAIIDAFNKQQSTPLSKNSPFTKTRKLRMSLADAIAKGMELKHDNFADTFAEYYKSILGAIHTKVAIDTLRVATDLEKRPLIAKTSMAPYGYQVINHPALRGLSIHPAIAAEMSHMFDVHTPTHLGFAYQFVNSALKRIAFVGSLFHGQTLSDVQMGMSLNPYKNVETTLKAVAGSTEFQKALKNPQPGDFVDKLIEQGLPVPSNSTGFTEDIGKNMSEGFKYIETQLNALFPGLGNISRGAAALDHLNTWIIFNRIGGGLMGQGAHIMFGKLKMNWLKEIEEAPTKIMPSDEELRRRAVAVSTKSFGSLNWRRMANEVHNKYMRAFLMSTFSPAGRRSIQSIMLAPEWLASTTLHWTKALFGKGEGSPFRPLNDVDLHRAWLLKSLFYSTLFGNALNYMFSGHSMMDNKDQFMIDLGDGQKTPWMKELSDFPRLIMDPAQEILNKLAPIPRLALQQFTGKEYLSAKGYSPTLKTAGDRVQNAVDTMSPFSMSQNNTGGLKADVASMLGHPIYGMTPTTKRDAEMKRKQELLREKMSKLSGGQ